MALEIKMTHKAAIKRANEISVNLDNQLKAERERDAKEMLLYTQEDIDKAIARTWLEASEVAESFIPKVDSVLTNASEEVAEIQKLTAELIAQALQSKAQD